MRRRPSPRAAPSRAPCTRCCPSGSAPRTARSVRYLDLERIAGGGIGVRPVGGVGRPGGIDAHEVARAVRAAPSHLELAADRRTRGRLHACRLRPARGRDEQQRDRACTQRMTRFASASPSAIRPPISNRERRQAPLRRLLRPICRCVNDGRHARAVERWVDGLPGPTRRKSKMSAHRANWRSELRHGVPAVVVVFSPVVTA